MNKIREIIKNKYCNGCQACVSKCPKSAISMLENEDGFLYPQIDSDKCTNCGLCDNVCSYLKNTSNNIKTPECYLYTACDEERKNSSSGGVFSVIAKYFIKNGGYVCGAMWDNNWKVKHKIINNLDEVNLLKSSKYIQSDIKNCYKDVEKILKQKEMVFFTGTPCQISGLKNFLGKEYDNLYTMDLICHGVPSPKVLYKYLNENFDLSKIESVSFRNKVPDGWSVRLSVKEDGVITKFEKSDFIDLFSNNVILRNSCGECVHNKLPRQGDITVGDFWEIGKYGKYVKDHLGISVVLKNNNKKAKFLLKILKKDAKIIKKTPISAATKRNINIYKSSTLHNKRDEFFMNLDTMSIHENKERILNNKCDVMMLNFWSSMNYGAILTALGIQSLVEKLGYNGKVINYIDALRKEHIKNSFCEKFANKYLNLTTKVETYDDFLELNKNCKMFICGSDQIFNGNIMESHSTDELTPFIYTLDFVSNKNKKISYAGSLGTNYFEGTKDFETLFKHYLAQLDYVSVREYETKQILDDYAIDSEVLIDAAFHIPIDKLEKMTSIYKTSEKYIAYFGLPYDKDNKNSWKKEVANEVSKYMNLPIKTISINDNTDVEEWLAFIKNSEFVLSDSYHAIVFAIRFKKRFIQLVRDNHKNCRFTTMYKSLGVIDNSISFYSYKQDITDYFVEQDWENIDKKIKNGVLNAEHRIKEILEKPKKCNDYIALDGANLAIAQNILTQRRLKFLLKRNEINKKYRKYKILKNLVFGNLKKKYNQKYKKYRGMVQYLRNNCNSFIKY